MTWFTERKSGHGYFQISDEVAATIQSLADDPGTLYRDAFAELADAIREIRIRVDTSPRVYIPPEIIQSLHDALVQIRDAAEQYKSQGDEGAARTVLTSADRLILNAQLLLPAGPREELTSAALKEAAARVAEATGVSATRLSEQRREAQELEASLAQRAEEALARVASSASEAVQNVDSARAEFTRNIESYETRLGQQAQRLDTAMDAQSQRFVKDQEDRTREFGEALSEIRDRAKARMGELEEQAEVSIHYLAARADEAKSIVAATAAASTAKRYVETEEAENKAADWWRKWGLLILGVTAALGLVIQIEYGPEFGAGWEEFVVFYMVKAPLVALPIYIGAYALRQSAAHRGRATEAGRVARELSVFRPFIDELPDGAKHEEISGAAKRYFLGSRGADGAMDVPLSPPRP